MGAFFQSIFALLIMLCAFFFIKVIMTKNRSSQSERLCKREGKIFLVCSRMWEYNKGNDVHCLFDSVFL